MIGRVKARNVRSVDRVKRGEATSLAKPRRKTLGTQSWGQIYVSLFWQWVTMVHEHTKGETGVSADREKIDNYEPLSVITGHCKHQETVFCTVEIKQKGNGRVPKC